MRVKYIGSDNPVALRSGKIYEARQLKKGWFGIVDESGEEYAYPPEYFEIIPDQYDPPLPKRIENPTEEDKERLRQVLLKYRNLVAAKGKDTSFWEEELAKL